MVAKNNNERAEAQQNELWQKEELLRKAGKYNNEGGGVRERGRAEERKRVGSKTKERNISSDIGKKNGSVKT